MVLKVSWIDNGTEYKTLQIDDMPIHLYTDAECNGSDEFVARGIDDEGRECKVYWEQNADVAEVEYACDWEEPCRIETENAVYHLDCAVYGREKEDTEKKTTCERFGDLKLYIVTLPMQRPIYNKHAYLELGEGGDVYVYGYPNENHQEDTWNKRAVRWSVSPLSTAMQCNDKMRQSVAILARIHAGREIVSDGQNLVGHYDDDARDAIKEMEEALSSFASG